MDRIVAFIPARGGSKSIPLKNIKLLAGKPLIYWTIEAALNCEKIDRVYVSTESIAIRKCVKSIINSKLQVIPRSKESATDTASTENAMQEFAQDFNFEIVILIQATSPLLTSEDLAKGIKKLDISNADSLLSVVKQKRFIWEEEKFATPLNYDYFSRPRRQDFEGFLVENGAFYITSKKNLLKTKCRISGKIALYEMDKKTYFEIDEPDDWIVVEEIMKSILKKKSSIAEKLKNIKLLACDVDGVLTDSGMYYTENGDELKKFNTRDGMGFEILRNLGIKTAIITSEDTKIVNKRAEKLKIDFLLQRMKNKQKAINELAEKEELKLEEIAYIGDDINDTEMLRMVGFSCCPQDAIEENKIIVDYVCNKKGGEGCVREVCDLLKVIKNNEL